MRLLLVAAICCVLAAPLAAQEADEAIFSGPQPGEKLSGFKLRELLGEQKKEIDLVAEADGGPLMIVFIHEITRPSLGLARAVVEYAAGRQKDGLTTGVVFLSADATETENWARRASNALPTKVPLGISVDGAEGPGAYGLNRKVALTVLVGKEGKVTANFALVQPSLQADAPKIGQAIVDVLGGGKGPTLAEMGVDARGGYTGNEALSNDELRRWLAPVINKSASDEEVTAAAEKVEKLAADKPAVKQQLGGIARRIVDGGKLENYGTPKAQEYIARWAKEWGAKEQPRRDDGAGR